MLYLIFQNQCLIHLFEMLGYFRVSGRNCLKTGDVMAIFYSDLPNRQLGKISRKLRSSLRSDLPNRQLRKGQEESIHVC